MIRKSLCVGLGVLSLCSVSLAASDTIYNGIQFGATARSFDNTVSLGIRL